MEVLAKKQSQLITPVLIGGAILLCVSFSIRAAFGVFQIPIAESFDWPRSTFSMAIAIQNLAWGFGQPIFGAIAEKIGDRRAIVLGVILYVLGLSLTALSSNPYMIQSLEVLVGFGVAGTGFGVILAIIGRASSEENRSLSLGIATAAGSAGQIFGPPTAEFLLTLMDWRGVFFVFSGLILASLLALPLIPNTKPNKTEIEESMTTVLRRAARDPSYHFIFIGFFSCGFQLAFVTAHFPAMVTELCAAISPTSMLHAIGVSTTSALGAFAIAVIGLTNIIGSILAGYLGRYFPKKYLLSLIYLGRTIAAIVFIMNPITPLSVLIFSAVMGFLWLATVPLTSGIVAYIYGLRYMGTLYGIVFFSHQLGSFLGVWLGGALYDIYGDYTIVWWVGIGVGALSAVINLPIIERPYESRQDPA